MKRYAGGVAAVALVLGLGACSSGDDKRDDPPKASSATTSSGASQDEMIGKFVAGEPPRDVTWMSGQPPADWKKLDAETGTAQWQIADTRCIITITQPAGLGSEDNPTDDELADEQVRRLVEASKAKNVTTPEEGTVMVPAKINDLDDRVEQKFTTRTFEADDDSIAIFLESLVVAATY